MSADYSFYALLCGFMPRPEGVQRSQKCDLFLFWGLSPAVTSRAENSTPNLNDTAQALLLQKSKSSKGSRSKFSAEHCADSYFFAIFAKKLNAIEEQRKTNTQR